VPQRIVLYREADGGSVIRYDHNMRMDERSRLKSVGNEDDFQIVCGNMYSAIFMMNSSGYGEFEDFLYCAIRCRSES
jgi:hypothetical protein